MVMDFFFFMKCLANSECVIADNRYIGTVLSPFTHTHTQKLLSTGIPFTIVQLGFYYENFLSVFKPHPTGKNEFAIG